ncbi:DUF1439 domain-containing protein [Lacimicrobium sp. SS2-24]|uniref:DUF1439 domain-containing protein n=1 Tax=Lacimicrobium sp. SS2-24 TaxID=2005569 RepID=UPI00113027BA|nr:DUF1439 domain-containing protein [Lacimicrobium sp. SS2-24]
MIRIQSGRFGRLKYWLLTLMVRWGRLRQVEMTRAELDDMLAPHLPLHFDIRVPRGVGRIKVIAAQTELGGDDTIEVALTCEFNITVLGYPMYQAHLLILIRALPGFDKASGTIFAEHIKLVQIHLIKDSYALIKDAREIMTALLPRPLGGMFNLGIELSISSALTLLENSLYGDMGEYMKLYINGSKQRVLDYHKPQIEQQLLAYLDKHQPAYTLDKTLLDERLFAEYGQQIKAEKDHLLFLF